MEIGDLVTFNGKAYVLRGLDPTGVPDRSVLLEDPDDGAQITVPFAALGEHPSGGGLTRDP